jgi:hypothetical protein
MCNVLFDFLKTGNVSFNDVKNDINCSWETPPIPSPTPGPTPPAEPVEPVEPVRPVRPVGPPSTPPYWKQIVIVLVGIFIILALKQL